MPSGRHGLAPSSAISLLALHLPSALRSRITFFASICQASVSGALHGLDALQRLPVFHGMSKKAVMRMWSVETPKQSLRFAHSYPLICAAAAGVQIQSTLVVLATLAYQSASAGLRARLHLVAWVDALLRFLYDFYGEVVLDAVDALVTFLMGSLISAASSPVRCSTMAPRVAANCGLRRWFW